jgi:hypothetical protein
MTNEEKKEKIWEEIFLLQKRACIGRLCLLDQLRFSDLNSQLKTLESEEN